MPDEEKLSSYLNKSKLISNSNYEKKIRIAILGGFTLNGLEETMRVKCDEKRIQCTTYVSGYNQYNQEILDEKSQLYKFSPDITFLIIDSRTILGKLFLNPYSVSIEERKQFVQNKSDEIINLAKSLVEKSKSKLVISNFSVPSYSPIGINETREEFGLHDMVRVLNENIKIGLSIEPEIFIYALNSFVTRFGENNVFDYKQYFYGDVRISLDYIPYLAEELMGYIKAVLGLNKKCIVLDLDNTLWGGIVGEDGFEGIKLGDSPVGRAYTEFQHNLLALNQRGILLAINSKNNFDDAMQIIKDHPNMVLKEDNFVCIRINWNDKVVNMKEISDELNIGLDSMVFFDDDPVNREYVKSNLPEIQTVDISDPSNSSKILKSINDFQMLKITDEDMTRNKMYLEQRKRTELKTQVGDLQDFLKQLNISVKIKNADSFTIPRISQLTIKTNQFNLTTRRYQEEDIRKFSQDKDKIVECAQVEDKFGDNGITGVYIINKDNKQEWTIDTFLLSCRIIGRGVEDGMLHQIIEKARKEGVSKIRGEYIKTKKNKPAENFFPTFGFKKEGNFWILDTKNHFKKPQHLVMS
jgi:FkbH-like protein|tara:strand:- start:4185 stop:5930 length:1746 start_codon:yes stop_codon:yes gene_type:complete